MVGLVILFKYYSISIGVIGNDYLDVFSLKKNTVSSFGVRLSYETNVNDSNCCLPK